MSRRKRFFDLLKQTPLALGFLAIAGAVTYLIIMLLRWLADLSTAEGLMHTLLFGAAVAVGLALFVGAVWMYMQNLGANDVNFLRSKGIDKAEMKPELFCAGCTFLISLAVYAVLLWVMSLADFWLLSGPAGYIAAALNLRWGTPFDSIRLWCSVVGFITCAVWLFPAMLMGYKKGFENKLNS